MKESLFNLIDGIIEELVSQKSNLENVLIKTQVLAFKLKNDNLKNWVNNELNGYDDQEEIPEFRIVGTQVKGHLFQGLGFGGYQQLLDTVLPIESLRNEELKFLREHKFEARISQLQELSKSKDGLIAELPYSFLVQMSKKMSPWEVIKAWKVIPPSAITGILSSIKSSLMNFLLELKEELGDDKIPLMEKENKIDKIIEKNIGRIKAEHVNISFGDKNNQSSNSGNENQLQLASGDKSNQKIEDVKIKELLNYITEHLDKLGVQESDKDEILSEVKRAERQLSKPLISVSIINQSLKVIYDILVGVAGNAYTDKVLLWITQLGNNIG